VVALAVNFKNLTDYELKHNSMGLDWVLLFVDRSGVLHEFSNDLDGVSLGGVNGISGKELAELGKEACQSIC
jgi:hypothetical protein